MTTNSTLAIIGGGPSALFALRHALADADAFRRLYTRIIVLERAREVGPGMPYSREQTSVLNLSNISSEELPPLPQTFAEWLSAQPPARLRDLGVIGPVKTDEIYPRVALGDYFRAQFENLRQELGLRQIIVEPYRSREAADIVPLPDGGYEIVTGGGERHACGTVLIATGHVWKHGGDTIYHTSPWPIRKLLPPEGEYYNFPIGLLGASLSAVDVINVLAHHHGRFHDDNGTTTYEPLPGAEDFELVTHSADGLLSQLQFEQVRPIRELYRHCTRDEIIALRQKDGYLRLADYFDSICRPVLIEALRADGLDAEADHLAGPSSTFQTFADRMTRRHSRAEPFRQMKREFQEAEKMIRQHKPTRWKEVLDDLMYTLNFHARLLPAEDHLELKARILPFVMNVMASLPLQSARLLLAVHAAGKLKLVPGKAEIEHGKGEPTVKLRVHPEDGEEESLHEYRMFIDCAGQAPIDEESFPFASLVSAGLVTAAVAELVEPGDPPGLDPDHVRTTAGKRLVELGGMAVTDDHQLLAKDGRPSPGLYDIAVPHAAGLRPYCYGLQACDEAAGIVMNAICRGTDRPAK